jgi:hypothetical protein
VLAGCAPFLSLAKRGRGGREADGVGGNFLEQTISLLFTPTSRISSNMPLATPFCVFPNPDSHVSRANAGTKLQLLANSL